MAKANIPRVVNYGGVDGVSDETGVSRRRSTISTLRASLESAATDMKAHLRSHTMSTLAICTSVLSMIYLLMSAFPYSGFMAMQLFPGLTHESAGTYAGILSGSFMIGRLFSAYPWGKIADTYGRKFVILFSNISSAVLCVAFGCSTSFAWAVSVRFLTGFCNGTMIAARVSVTELARGDHELEAKGMGMVMSMVGYGMLIGPAIGGVLSEPVQQYPDVDWGKFERMLTTFPFVLPNLIGGILCIISTILIFTSVEETLPPNQQRSAKYFLPDGLGWIAMLPKRFWELAKSWTSGYQAVGESNNAHTTGSIDDDDDDECDSIEEDLKILASKDFGEQGDAICYTTRSSRASFSAALHKPHRASVISTLSVTDETGHSKGGDSQVSANISSLMRNKRVRELLISYWSTTFASTAAGECFPLFCMAREGGLGIEETAIGMIGAGSGLLFCISQYFIFAFSIKTFGLHKTMVNSGFLAVIPAILIPLSLLMKDGPGAMIYLSVLNAIMLIFFSNWNAALTIIQNRAVHASDRAKLNGLAAIGASVGRGGGPLFAGILVTFSYTSGIVPTQYGSLIVYTVVAAMGAAAFIKTYRLEDEEEQEE